MENKVTLYDILEAKKELERIEGLSEEDQKSYWQAINVQEGNKIDNTVKYLREAELTAEMCEEEIKRLEKLKQFYENRANRIKQGIAYSMEAFNVDRIETGFTKVYFRDNKSVVVVDQNSIPQEFIKVKEVKSVDKIAIKKAIENGKTVIGAEIRVNKSLQIK